MFWHVRTRGTSEFRYDGSKKSRWGCISHRLVHTYKCIYMYICTCAFICTCIHTYTCIYVSIRFKTNAEGRTSHVLQEAVLQIFMQIYAHVTNIVGRHAVAFPCKYTCMTVQADKEKVHKSQAWCAHVCMMYLLACMLSHAQYAPDQANTPSQYRVYDMNRVRVPLQPQLRDQASVSQDAGAYMCKAPACAIHILLWALSRPSSNTFCQEASATRACCSLFLGLIFSFKLVGDYSVRKKCEECLPCRITRTNSSIE